ncbi:uncharacterized protein LOC128680757 isoform X2 [Plodia interpunctella]|nr:uncharacterized protein LOC128680757 isoform X2 [Plodia interpunctella]
MGSQPPIRGARPPSHIAYYVALAGVVGLLLLLCCYFLFFCIKRVKELTVQEYCNPAPTASPKPAPSAAAYPIQPGVRDTASAMAKLCRQLPSQPVGGAVFPAETAPPSSGPGKIVTTAVTVDTVDEVPVR